MQEKDFTGMTYRILLHRRYECKWCRHFLIDGWAYMPMGLMMPINSGYGAAINGQDAPQSPLQGGLEEQEEKSPLDLFLAKTGRESCMPAFKE